MAMSLSNFLLPCCALVFAALAHADTVTYDFNVTWVYANPDGLFTRPTMGINGQWPIPQINVNKGDQLVVNLHNQLGNQSTSLHFHGLYQNGSTHMDGTVGVSQCEVPPGSSFTYNFTVDQPGTYWYHSHVRGQYPDGLRGPLIVHDSAAPFEYDQELVMTLSDWYHEQMQVLLPRFVNVENPTGAEPAPNAALINDAQNTTFAMQAGKTYFFRIINMGAFTGQYLWFEGHSMRVVEVDGIYTQPSETQMLYITVAQRYGVLVTARNDTTANFAIVSSMDQDLLDTVPSNLNPNATAYLQYSSSAPLPTARLLDAYEPLDDMTLVPADLMPTWTDPATHTLTLSMNMGNLGDGANYAFVNNVSYVTQKVPTLYTALSAGADAANPTVYGLHSNSFVLAHGELVELVLNNRDAGKHPWHLHGHDFQVLARSSDNAGDYNPANTTSHANTTTPMRRDTLMVPPNGHFVVRFRADNPGVWLFHCHIEWHVATGLVATFVEAPLALQANLTIPPDHFAVCAAGRPAPTPTVGNAAANVQNYLDLDGQNLGVAPLPDGFTAGGIVALVFSCLAALLGMATIAWYGAAPIGRPTAIAALSLVDAERKREPSVSASPRASTSASSVRLA